MRKFEMNQEILKNLIFKQSGSLEKAILEAFQNSIDASSTKIELDMNEKGFIFTDNGKGMNETEINDYFRVFGNSSKKNDSNSIGNFGIGRGQLFAYGFITWSTQNNKMCINAKRSLEYTHRKKVKKNFKGTKISCLFFETLDSYKLNKILDEIRSEILSKNIEITINKQKLSFNCEKIYENIDFEAFESFESNLVIYSQNLRITTQESIYNFIVNCKSKMNLNFARNEFISNDKKTLELNSFVKEIEQKLTESKNTFNESESCYLLKKIARNELNISELMYKKILHCPNGTFYSFVEIEGKTVIFGSNDRSSDMAIESGYLVLSDNQEYYLTNLKLNGKINFNIFSKTCKQMFPTMEYNELELTELNTKQLVLFYSIIDMNDKIFRNERIIKLGKSPNAKGWTDGNNEITIDISVLYENITTFFLSEVFELLLHEYSHNEKSYDIVSHSTNFNSQYRELMTKYINPYSMYLKNFTFLAIKETYRYELSEIKKDIEKKKVISKGKKQFELVNLILSLNKKEFSTKDLKQKSKVDYHNQLANFVQKGFLIVIKTIGKTVFYELTEKFNNLTKK